MCSELGDGGSLGLLIYGKKMEVGAPTAAAANMNWTGKSLVSTAEKPRICTALSLNFETN